MKALLTSIFLLAMTAPVFAGDVSIIAARSRKAINQYKTDLAVLTKAGEHNIVLPDDASWLSPMQVELLERAALHLSNTQVATDAASFEAGIASTVGTGNVVTWNTTNAQATGADPDNCIAIGKLLCTAAGNTFLGGGGKSGSCRVECEGGIKMQVKVN